MFSGLENASKSNTQIDFCLENYSEYDLAEKILKKKVKLNF